MHKILIVDDDATTLKLLVHTVDSMGLTGIAASSARKALSILEDNKDIGLIITDMKMPEIDGREFISILQSQNKLKDIPVIIISGLVRLSEISDILKNGAARFVPKPLEIASLKKYIINLLGIINDNHGFSAKAEDLTGPGGLQ